METKLITKRYESALAGQFADLQSIRRDLNRTIEMLNLLVPEFNKPDDQQNSVLIEGLWSAGLVNYARCFAEGKRWKLDESTIFVGLPEIALSTHKWALGMRNKLIAHSVNPFEECMTHIAVDESDMPKSWGIGFFLAILVHQKKEGAANLVLLCELLRDKVRDKCEALQKELQIEVNKLTSNDLKKLPLAVYTAPGADAATAVRMSSGEPPLKS